MQLRKYFKRIFLSAIILSAFYLFCVTPENPYSDLKTSSQLLLKNSLGKVDSLSIEDSIGKPVSIGIYRYLPKNVDSLRLTVTSKLSLTSTTSNTVLDTAMYFFNVSQTYDTLWKQITFKSAGNFLVQTSAYTSFKTILSDSATIIIHDRSVPNNSPPKWETDTIKMNVFPGAAISINLADTCVDPNNDQLSFCLLLGLPARDTIIGSLYRFTPLVADTGSFAIHIVASNAQGTDTLTMALTIRPTIPDSNGPILRSFQPDRDSSITAVNSMTISIVAKDANGIASVFCSFGSAAPTVTTTDSIYSATITGLIANQFNKIRFIATDASSNGNKETLFVFVKYVPTINDTKKPTLKRKTPAIDSLTVSSASATISVIAMDSSGIASIVCSLGDSIFTVTAADSTYSATVKGLIASKYNKIRFIATDASNNGNRETLYVTLKYDPTIADNSPPIFTKINGPIGPTVTTPTVSYEYAITDTNGIDSAYWTLNGTRQGHLFIDASEHYKLNATLSPQSNRIVIHAWDKSTNHNRDSVVITLNYTPPCIVRFDSKGGSAIDSQKVNYGDKATEPPVKPKMDGHSFGGWYKDEAYTTKWNFESDNVTTNVTLYAKWTINQYTISFNSLGGSQVSSEQRNYGDTVIMPANPSFTGNKFGGWFKEASCNTKWGFGTFKVTQDTTLYAKWTVIQDTVFFNSHEGSVVSPIPVNYGLPITKPQDSKRKGYEFYAWYTDATLTTQWNFSDVVTNNMTLHAKWTINQYAVKFDLSGITSHTTPTSIPLANVTFNTFATKPFPDPKKTSYVFSGWCRDAACKNLWNFYSDVVTSDTTLYARWEIKDIDGNVYTEVNINGQVWMVENLKTTTYIDSQPIPLITDSISWSNLNGCDFPEAYCYYGNNDANKNSYGALYTAGMLEKNKPVAPKGWHVPSYDEWDTLITNLGGTSAAAAKLKDGGSSGFKALLGGYRSSDGGFYGMSSEGHWWTNNTASICAWVFYHMDPTKIDQGGNVTTMGISVRCKRDW
jgi:uncharacterized protein (TIGR02145 family)/uncharacterized repeat protein (TIGR02543 family)